MDDQLSHEELKKRLRVGYVFSFETPGLLDAARELIQPVIEEMQGKEIIYSCRATWLVHVDKVKVDGVAFTAHATFLQEIRDSSFPMRMDGPFSFGARWDSLHMSGAAIAMNQLPDRFYPDQALVSEVKVAAVRKALPDEIARILNHAGHG